MPRTERLVKNFTDLSGRVAVVIGGTSGLGRTIAIGLAEAGADVVATGRRADLVDEVAAAVGQTGARTLRLPVDIASRESIDALRDRVEAALRARRIEFRRGTSGGGNQLRQPYLKALLGDDECLKYPRVDHVHFYGFYIGNYPGLRAQDIDALCRLLNAL